MPLIDLSNKVNLIHLTYTMKLDFCTKKIDNSV